MANPTPYPGRVGGSRPSTTARVVAFLRACAYCKRKGQSGGPDNLARVFFPGPARLFSLFSALTLPPLKLLLPGLYEYIMARTAFFDHLFCQALKTGVPQIVLLGAGYDTRAIRFRKQVRATRIFELDAPATQHIKRTHLERAGIELPRYLHLAAIDLERDDLGQVLATAGLDRHSPTLFLAEGITMYLSAATMAAILDFVAQRPPPSSVAFDYAYQEVLEDKKGYYDARTLVGIVARLGEAYHFGIGQGQIVSFLAEKGLNVVAYYTPQALQNAFLTSGAGSLQGRIATYYGNVYAVVKPPVDKVRAARGAGTPTTLRVPGEGESGETFG